MIEEVNSVKFIYKGKVEIDNVIQNKIQLYWQNIPKEFIHETKILVVSDGYNTMLASAKALADGVYNEELRTMRATATTFFQY